MIYLIALISFLLGFLTNLIAFPYLLVRFVKGAWGYLGRISTSSIFRWSVSLITSFTLSALII